MSAAVHCSCDEPCPEAQQTPGFHAFWMRSLRAARFNSRWARSQVLANPVFPGTPPRLSRSTYTPVTHCPYDDVIQACSGRRGPDLFCLACEFRQFGGYAPNEASPFTQCVEARAKRASALVGKAWPAIRHRSAGHRQGLKTSGARQLFACWLKSSSVHYFSGA